MAIKCERGSGFIAVNRVVGKRVGPNDNVFTQGFGQKRLFVEK